MYDLSRPNVKPGKCEKCQGTGHYGWGAFVNGKPTNCGTCFSCRGTGRQTRRDIKRNETYNRFKIASIARI